MKKKRIIFLGIICLLFLIDTNVSAKIVEVVSCGSVKDIPKKIPEITRLAMNILKIIAPIAIVIFGSIDFLKAITAQKEDEISGGLNKFIKRLIMGGCVFLTFAFVQFLLATFTNYNSVAGCISCFLSSDSDCNHYQKVISEGTQSYDEPSSGGANDNEGSLEDNNLSLLYKFVSNNEGATNECTVTYGSAKGEKGYKIVNLGDNTLSISFGLTSHVLANIKPSNNCFDNNNYYEYYKSSNFKEGNCVPKGSLKGASKCTYAANLNVIKNTFSNYCPSDFEFEKAFNINQIHSLIDRAHGGIINMQSSIKAYCDVLKDNGSSDSAEKAYWLDTFKLSKGNNFGGNTRCNYLARRECEADLFYNGEYNCNPYNNASIKKYKFKEYHEKGSYNICY